MASLAQKSRPGRPTREQSEQRHQELLDRAMEMFLERGFEHATIRDIAAEVGMTRRTVYARYPDKRALFKAIVEHAVQQVMLPVEALHALDGKDLEETLTQVARLRIANVMTPVGLRLQRILHTESYQFPEVVNSAYSRITRPAIEFIADLLRRNNAAGVTDVEEPERAASALMNMVVGVPVRMVLLGNFLGPEEIEDRIRFSVRLFMRGVCRR
ncbi:MAG TPA: TetR/AcrR family transcriptional regulator [Sphingobium sp.]|nr:TetR/AcrR family transcriptional regulator [Sphingobium sp.]